MNKTFSRDRLGRMAEAMRSHVARGELTGAVTLLARGDEVHVDAFGDMHLDRSSPMRQDAIFRMASVTKLVTGVLGMRLIEEGRLRLDDTIDELLPELANRRVLRAIDAELEDTVPAERAITVRDVLTFRLGYGAIMRPPGQLPIQRAMESAGLSPGPHIVSFSADEYIVRLGALPLCHQPGAQWMYHSGSEVLGVLLARASGVSLGELFRSRIFEPLGMSDTGFTIPRDKLSRLPSLTGLDPVSRKIGARRDVSKDWSAHPLFESGGAGLVSTANDLLAFARMLRDGGGVLSTEGLREVTRDHLTAEQKAASPFFPGFWDSRGWGYGMSVITGTKGVWWAPGSFGWDGGFGTSLYVDPENDLIAILLTQRLFESPVPSPLFCDFWDHAYRVLETVE